MHTGFGDLALVSGGFPMKHAEQRRCRNGRQDPAPAHVGAEKVRKPSLLHGHDLVEIKDGEPNREYQADDRREAARLLLGDFALGLIPLPARRPFLGHALGKAISVFGQLSKRGPSRCLEESDRKQGHTPEKSQVGGVDPNRVQPGLLAVHG